MRYQDIPGTDLRLSAICFGAAQLGTAVNESEAFRLLDQFVEGGGNFIDTARAYAIWVPGGEGMSEAIIGRWLKARGHRESVTVATKGGHPPAEDMTRPRLSREDLVSDVNESLRALDLDTIALYWLHRDDPERPLADIFETLERLRGEGKIRHYGCSNWKTGRIREALGHAQAWNLGGFVANQPQWSLARLNGGRTGDPTSVAMDEEMWAFHRSTHLPVIPYTAQAGGFFSKWAERGHDRIAPGMLRRYDNAVNRVRFGRLRLLSQETGRSMTVLSLAWLTSQPDVPVIPIVSARRAEQLAELLSAGDHALDPDEIEFLAAGV